MAVFADRTEAGRLLARQLEHLRGQDVVVLGLPRGGVPVAAEVARALGAPLDVIVVRKLGLPWHRELAMGAIGEGGAVVLDEEVLASSRVSDDGLAEVERAEQAELARRVALLRRGRNRVDLTGRVVVLVDDGIATGSTMRAACEVARSLGASRVVVAVPVAPAGMRRQLPVADELVCVREPARLRSVGEHYRDFSQTSEEDVVALLDSTAARPSVPARGAGQGAGPGDDLPGPRSATMLG